MRRHRHREHGGALLVTMILIGVLLAGGVAVVGLQLRSTRGADLAKTKSSSRACAEAGLVAARQPVVANYVGWNAALAAGTEPPWLAGIDKDVDGNGTNDVVITLVDNADDIPADPARDADLQVFVVSTCMLSDPHVVRELIRFNGGGNCYDAQLGGCGGNNNAN